MEKKPQTQTAAAVLMKDSQGQKLNRLLLCLVMLVAVVLIAAFVPKADAATLDDGGFCIQATYGDEGINGVRGPASCQMTEGTDPEPQTPEATDALTYSVLTPQLPGLSISWQSMPPGDTYTGLLKDRQGNVVYTIKSTGWYQTLGYYTVSENDLPDGQYIYTMIHDATGKTSEELHITVLRKGFYPDTW